MKALVVIVLVALAGRTAHAESCSFTAVTAVAFGSYDVFDTAPLLSVGSIAYTCTDVQASDTVAIEISGAPDATTLRAMVQGAEPLAYQLYVDPSRTLVWGTGTGGTGIYGPVHPGEGAPTSVPIYARLPARQDVSAGSYSDTVTVTMQL